MLMFENNKININGLLFALPDDTVVVPNPKNITHVAFFKKPSDEELQAALQNRLIKIEVAGFAPGTNALADLVDNIDKGEEVRLDGPKDVEIAGVKGMVYYSKWAREAPLFGQNRSVKGSLLTMYILLPIDREMDLNVAIQMIFGIEDMEQMTEVEMMDRLYASDYIRDWLGTMELSNRKGGW